MEGDRVVDRTVQLVQSAVARSQQAQFIPGGVVGVVTPGADGGPQTAVVPFGVADAGTGRPVDADTSFEIGSLTKLFTAAVLSWAVAEPSLAVALASPLQDFAPVRVPSPRGSVITMGQLVTHRSGLPKMPGNAAHGPVERGRYSAQDLWSALSYVRLVFPPGSAWGYSNFGFGLIGTVLSEITERPYADLIDEIVCRPLGMAATGLEHLTGRTSAGLLHWWHHASAASPDEAPPPNVAIGYESGSTPRRPIVAPQWNNTGALAGSGGIVSTGNDMTRFLAAAAGYSTGAVAATLARAEELIPSAGPDQQQMAMAWQIHRPVTSPPRLFKNGGTSGMHCAMAVHPRVASGAGGTGVLVLTNGPDHVDDLTIDLLKAVSGGQ